MILRHDDHCWGWTLHEVVASTISHSGSGRNCSVAKPFDMISSTVKLVVK
jgi:hypothetical protein